MSIFKFLGKLLLIIIILLIIVTVALSIYGYIVSRQILNEKSIETAVKEIKDKDIYTRNRSN